MSTAGAPLGKRLIGFLRRLLQDVAYDLGRVPYRIVLERRGDCFAVAVTRGRQRDSLNRVFNKNAAFAELTEGCRFEGSDLIVPLSALERVRGTLRRLSSDRRLRVSIAPEVDRLAAVRMPADFRVQYVRVQERGRLERRIAGGAIYGAGGWWRPRPSTGSAGRRNGARGPRDWGTPGSSGTTSPHAGGQRHDPSALRVKTPPLPAGLLSRPGSVREARGRSLHPPQGGVTRTRVPQFRPPPVALFNRRSRVGELQSSLPLTPFRLPVVSFGSERATG